MTTLSHTRPHLSLSMATSKSGLFLVPLGRIFYSLIFIFAGFSHFTSGSIAYASNSGVPYAQILVPLSGVMALLGGLSIALGYKARFGGLLIFFFLLPVTLMMHNFWIQTDPALMQAHMAHFMKNIALIGGSILFAFYGAGPLSIDSHNKRTKR